MKPEQLEKWRVVRSKGMLRYVLVNGVLSYGLAMFIAMTFFVHGDELSPRFIGLSAVMWSIGGAIFGISMWYLQERQFRKANGAAA